MAISIHALLAESDALVPHQQKSGDRFLSTLSLRRATGKVLQCVETPAFLSTLSLRRATIAVMYDIVLMPGFLSTLSLRRATLIQAMAHLTARLFLSTLSLRRATYGLGWEVQIMNISIHALLAESDQYCCPYLSSLTHFYPRSPCGERRSGHR